MPQPNIGLWINPNSGRLNGEKWGKKIPLLFPNAFVIQNDAHYQSLLHNQQIQEIWIIGGDGTLHHFLNKFGIPDIPISLLPGGTGNDAFRTMGFPKKLKTWLQKWEHSTIEYRDVGSCNQILFHNCCGAGFDAEVAHDLALARRKIQKKPAYLPIVLKKLWNFDGQINAQGLGIVERNYFMLNVNIGKFIGGGFKITPLGACHDGLMDVCAIPSVKKWKRWFYLPVLAFGLHPHLSWIFYKKVSNISIKFDHPTLIQMDGEVYQMKEMTLEIIPKKLKMRVLN